MLSGLSFVRSFASRLRGGAWLRGQLRSGRVIFFHFASLRKKNTGLSAPLSKSRARPGPPWPGPSRLLRRRRLIINLLSDAALDTPRPRPPPGGSPPGSALHNRRLCKLPPTPSPTPPRSRVADRPALFPAINLSGLSNFPPVHPYPPPH
jgi:hypothetical protein